MISRTFTNPILLGLLYVNYFAKKLSEVIFIGGHLELATILNRVIFEGGTIVFINIPIFRNKIMIFRTFKILASSKWPTIKITSDHFFCKVIDI